MERPASIPDVAHLILADVNLNLLLVHNDLIFMQLRYFDPELAFVEVTEVVYRSVEKPIPIDSVNLRLQCASLALCYGEPVCAAKEVIAPSPTHGESHTMRSSQTKPNRLASRVRKVSPSVSFHAKPATTPTTP